jgi:hypothetical protein
MSDLVKWTLADERLIDLAANNASADLMEKETGIPAAQALARVKQLLREFDIWTVLERKRLLLHSAYKLKAQIEAETVDVTDSDSINAYLRTLKAIGDMLDRQSSMTDDELDRVTKAQAVKLIQLLTVATEHAKGILALSAPEADLAQIDEALKSGLQIAALEIE